MTTATADAYATTTTQPTLLAQFNPLAKFAAVIPAIIALVFTRDLATPLAFLVLSYALLLFGVPLTRRVILVLAVALPGAVLLLGFGLAIWADPERVAHTPAILTIGEWTLHEGAILIGLATGLRLTAMFALGLIAGLSSTGVDIVRASVQNARLPYRVGYAALAAFRFVPRFRYELDVIRQAHRIRGSHGGWGPFGVVARWSGYVVPLLAGAIRHAERVALAMDARAFGAHRTRTERHLVPFRWRDLVFIIVLWAATAALFLTLRP